MMSDDDRMDPIGQDSESWRDLKGTWGTLGSGAYAGVDWDAQFKSGLPPVTFTRDGDDWVAVLIEPAPCDMVVSWTEYRDGVSTPRSVTIPKGGREVWRTPSLPHDMVWDDFTGLDVSDGFSR